MQDTGLSLLLLWLLATTGNVLGSVANWGLGRFGYHLRHRRWFPVAEAQLERARGYFLRWGSVSLLLAWLPVVGDPLTLLAGLLRVSFCAVFSTGNAGQRFKVCSADWCFKLKMIRESTFTGKAFGTTGK